jgi:hypothetical protein
MMLPQPIDLLYDPDPSNGEQRRHWRDAVVLAGQPSEEFKHVDSRWRHLPAHPGIIRVISSFVSKVPDAEQKKITERIGKLLEQLYYYMT